MTIKESLSDSRRIRVPMPASTAIAHGDLLWLNSGVAAKASAQSDQGSEAANQLLFKAAFLGVMTEDRLLTETDTTPGSDRTVTADGIFDCTSPARSWVIGDLVAASEDAGGTFLENQQVEYTTDNAIAIGYCVKTSAASATTVRCRLISHFLPNTVNRGALDTSLADDTTLTFGTGSDAKMEWSTGDASNHSLVLALGDTNQALHITDVGAIATDWNVSADTHPTLYVHSNTTPATDYMTFGAHDGTTGHINVVGGTTLSLDIGGTAVGLLTAAGLTLDQGANDSLGFALRSSDVATVLTTIVKGGTVTTTDYFSVAKASATLGGAYIQSLAEVTATESLHFDAWGGAPATTDTSGSLGAMNFFVGQHDGANGDADMAANSNAMVWGEIDASNARLTRMLLKADDGELHLGNATLVALDDHDDVSLARSMQIVSAASGIRPTAYDRPSPFEDYATLRKLGLVGERDASGFYLFPLQPRLALHEGAIWQLFNDVMAVAAALPLEVQARLPQRIAGRLAAPSHNFLPVTP